MAEKITIESAEPFRVCNSCYKGDRVYNIIIRYASTNSGTQISLCRNCLKKLNDAIGETLWKEDSARMAETHKKREETHACDSISRREALAALGEEPPVWTGGEGEIAERSQWRRDVAAIKAVPSAQPEVRPIDYQDCSNAMLKMWMDNVVTDGEYNRIMDKLNAHWGKRDG